MKVRNDFVTNSSSSSYVIAYRTPNEYTSKLIDAIINTTDYDDTRKATIIKKEDWERSFIDENSWLGSTVEEIIAAEDGLGDLYNRIMKLFEDGYQLMNKRISDHDQSFYNFLRTFAADNDDFVIVSGD